MFANLSITNHLHIPDSCQRRYLVLNGVEHIVRDSTDHFLLQNIGVESDPELDDVHEDSHSMVVIYFHDRGVMNTITDSYLVDTISLISNIGGGLGLALGISVFSVLEYVLDKIFEHT